MIRIAICDDDVIFTELLKTRISDFFMASCLSVNMDLYYDPRLLLRSTSHYDLYFLDIRMPEINGSQLAENLRQRPDEKFSAIIFISSMHEAVFDSFRFSPLRFIRKELLDLELAEALTAFLRMKESNPPAYTLELSEKHQNYSVPLSDILYIESNGHYLLFHCKNQTIRIRENISAYETLLLDHSFHPVRRGCIVNMTYVMRIDPTSVFLRSGEAIPLSRSCRSAFQSAYLAWKRRTTHVLTLGNH